MRSHLGTILVAAALVSACATSPTGRRQFINIPSPVPNFWRAICRREVKPLDWQEYHGWGATEALARRIAALRARAAGEGE